MHLSPASVIHKLISSAGSKVAGGAIAGILLYMIFRKVWRVDPKLTLFLLLGLIITALLCCLVVLLWRFLQAKHGEQLNRELVSQDEQRVAVKGVKANFQKAMVAYKASDRNIYDLPWILLIGEPASGKSTTLRESKLEFLLEEASLRGAGGTDKCDWWFTRDAVILDTAGRWTLPPTSDTSGGEWRAFLRLLARHRKRCPVNGVIVTIPTTSLLEDTPEAIREKAERIRGKLIELVRELGVEFPIYIMVSKLDLVPGFAEFCGSLSDIATTQVLGWNRLPDAGAYNPDEFSEVFELQVSRFHQWALRHLKNQPAGELSDRTYAFSSHFSYMKEKLGGYLNVIFKDDPFNKHPLMWRGCFFSSGLQENTAIDKAFEKVSGEDGLRMRPKGGGPRVRPYFIHNFYKKIFMEKGLVRLTGRAAVMDKRYKIASCAIALLFILSSLAYLYPSYKSLKTILVPIKKNVEAAEIIIRNRAAFPPERMGDIFPILEALEKGRNNPELKKYANKFLKREKGHSVDEDLKIVEDALMLKAGIRPMLTLAGEGIEKTEAETPEQKDRMVSALTQLLAVAPLKPLSGVRTKPMKPFMPEGSGHIGPEEEKQLTERIWVKYPLGRYPENFSVSPWAHGDKQYVSQLGEGVREIHRFWKSYPLSQWQVYQEKARKVSDAYFTILESRSQAAESGFAEKIENFITLSEDLIAYGEQNGNFSVKAFRGDCERDYKQLRQGAEGNSDPMIQRLDGILEKNSGVCRYIVSEINKHRDESLAHILKKDGSVTDDMKTMTGLMRSLETFGPLFMPEDKKVLADNQEKAVETLETWNENWEKKRKAFESELTESLKNLSTDWRHDQCKAVVKNYIDHVMWRADRQAADAALEALLTDHEAPPEFLKKNEDPPVTARAGWLVSRFDMLHSLKEGLKARHPKQPEVKTFARKAEKSAIETYGRCMTFWQTTLKKYKPVPPFLRYSEWNAFRAAILNVQGTIINPSEQPFKGFLVHMPWSQLKKLKKRMKRNRSASAREVEKTAYVYHQGGDLRENLMRSQNNFARVIQTAGDGSVQAVKNEEFRTLSEFSGKVYSDGVGRGERLAADLKKVEALALKLYKNKVGQGMEKQWQDFVSKWRPVLAGRFPFAASNGPGASEYPTASSADLSEFFFGPGGLDDFIRENELLSEKSGRGLGGGRDHFLKRCLAWKKFLFNQGGQTRIHSIHVKLHRSVSLRLKEKDAGKYFTNIDIDGLSTGSMDRLKLRFSGEKYRSGHVRWGIGNPIDKQITFNAYDQGISGRTASRSVSGGDVFMPAFTRSSGEGNALKVLLPDGGRGHYAARLTFRWDEPVPGLIGWAN